jgi:hypothetical protein
VKPPVEVSGLEVLPKSAFAPMMFCGKEFIRSVISVLPCRRMSWLETIVVGLVAVMLAGTGMREPVTTTSCKGAAAWSAGAAACCAGTAARNTLANRANRALIRGARVRVMYILPSSSVRSLFGCHAQPHLETRALP